MAQVRKIQQPSCFVSRAAIARCDFTVVLRPWGTAASGMQHLVAHIGWWWCGLNLHAMTPL
jgi:hypothetical protein